MEALTKKSKRLSSMFSLSSHHADNLPPPAMPPPPQKVSPAPKREKSPLPTLRKLRKASGDRHSVANFSYPNYSPPDGQQPVLPAHASNPNLAVPPLDSLSLLPPPPLFTEGPGYGSNPGSRTASPASSRPGSRAGSRPQTPINGQLPNFAANEAGNNKVRKKFMGGSKDLKDRGKNGNGPAAWIAGHEQELPYFLEPLLAGQKVSELWDDEGDTFVHLFPRNSGKGPSFRIHAAHYSSSPQLTRLAHGRVYSQSIAPDQRPGDVRRKPLDAATRQHSIGSGSSPITGSLDLQGLDSESSGSGSRRSRPLTDLDDAGPPESHLYLPIPLSTSETTPTAGGPETPLSPDEVDNLVSVRNLFAFLVGQSLVATERRGTIFAIFRKISELLKAWEFSNFDSSTFGEVATSSFDNYVEELNIADVRISREKTIEAIILGESMRSMSLYTEGYVHGVGKWEEIIKMKNPKINLISSKTQSRMERSAMDLMVRQKNVNTRLQDFDFPAIFSGIMNSKTYTDRKQVHFEAWRNSFMATRKYIMSYYKYKYGAWPPKASSKKNNLETSGLNRLVLRSLYEDMSALYDVLVDRTNLTTRTLEGEGPETTSEDESETIARALRTVLSEYDRSSPPVQPPVPFDVPLLPTKAFATGDAKKDAKARSRKLKDDEIRTILQASHNPDAVDTQHPFLAAFFDMEAKAAHGKSLDDLLDQRVGQWLFLYAILNSLPMLVVDAPGVRFTDKVEYFLCLVPRSDTPWLNDDARPIQRNWYGIAGSSGVVSLPADVVENGVEGIYRRSHAWRMAEHWSRHTGLLDAQVQELLDHPSGPPEMADLVPPPGIAAGEPTARPRSSRADSPGAAGRGKRESVMMLGLEALPVPAGVSPAGAPASRSASGAQATGATFDDILGGMPAKDTGKKKGKK